LPRHSIVVVSPPSDWRRPTFPRVPVLGSAVCGSDRHLRYSTTADRALPCVKQPVAVLLGEPDLELSLEAAR
jgi:hypothetical protein